MWSSSSPLRSPASATPSTAWPHIAEGKLPSKLALEWDGVISFVLTDNFVLSKLTSMEGTDAPSDDGDDPFDANVALFVGSMSSLIEELIEAMGGEADPA